MRRAIELRDQLFLMRKLAALLTRPFFRMSVINADGTYVDTDPKGKQVKGLYASHDGKDCFDPEGDELGMCWARSAPAADGSFSATADDGTVVTVTPKKK